jgi:hypothetical protein
MRAGKRECSSPSENIVFDVVPPRSGHDGGEDVLITVNMFDSADAALVYNTKAANNTREGPLSLLLSC